MSSLWEIFREQAPELALMWEQCAQLTVKNRVKNIPNKFIESGDINDFTKWFETQVQKLLEWKRLKEEILKNKDLIFYIFEAACDYATIKRGTDVEIWEEQREELKRRMEGNIVSNDLNVEYLEDEVQNFLVRKWYDITTLDLTMMDTIHLRELKRYIEYNFTLDRIVTRGGDETLWSVGKFWIEYPWYRMIVYQKKIIWIFSHSDYEAQFLESAYQGNKIPPGLREKIKL